MISEQAWREGLQERDPVLFELLQELEGGKQSSSSEQQLALRLDKLKADLLFQIVHYRLEAGLTQRTLADKLGMQQSNIARLESGKGNPSLRTLLQIIAALNVSIKLERGAE